MSVIPPIEGNNSTYPSIELSHHYQIESLMAGPSSSIAQVYINTHAQINDNSQIMIFKLLQMSHLLPAAGFGIHGKGPSQTQNSGTLALSAIENAQGNARQDPAHPSTLSQFVFAANTLALENQLSRQTLLELQNNHMEVSDVEKFKKFQSFQHLLEKAIYQSNQSLSTFYQKWFDFEPETNLGSVGEDLKQKIQVLQTDIGLVTNADLKKKLQELLTSYQVQLANLETASQLIGSSIDKTVAGGIILRDFLALGDLIEKHLNLTNRSQISVPPNLMKNNEAIQKSLSSFYDSLRQVSSRFGNLVGRYYFDTQFSNRQFDTLLNSCIQEFENKLAGFNAQFDSAISELETS